MVGGKASLAILEDTFVQSIYNSKAREYEGHMSTTISATISSAISAGKDWLYDTSSNSHIYADKIAFICYDEYGPTEKPYE